MDNRWQNIQGQRPYKLRKQDLAGLARLIVAILRRRGSAGVAVRGGVEVAILHDTAGHSLIVHKDDWSKILPLIQDGSFNSLLTPIAPKVGYLRRKEAYSEPILDRADIFLYERILSTLRGLFTEAFPTSNL